jgi:hypothetical protein
VFTGFPISLNANIGLAPQNRPRRLATASFITHNSHFTLTGDHSELQASPVTHLHNAIEEYGKNTENKISCDGIPKDRTSV